MASRGIVQIDLTQATEPSLSALPDASGMMLDLSVPLQIDQPNTIPAVNTVDTQDSGEERPSNWDEGYLPPESLKPSAGGFALPDQQGSLRWYQNTFSEQAHDEVGRMLSEADARRASFIAQAVEEEGQRDASENVTAILDSIVAQDPERYLAWLSTMGYYYFTTEDHNPYGFSWEDWCAWKAPRSFQLCCKLSSGASRPTFGPGSIDKSKYGPAGQRPLISLEEAKKGNQREMESHDGEDGLEVSVEEKPQYYMIGGQATSREAAAHYHAIRGQDVWLSDPTNFIIETNNDPGRQRELEVEASFRCQGQ